MSVGKFSDLEPRVKVAKFELLTYLKELLAQKHKEQFPQIKQVEDESLFIRASTYFKNDAKKVLRSFWFWVIPFMLTVKSVFAMATDNQIIGTIDFTTVSLMLLYVNLTIIVFSLKNAVDRNYQKLQKYQHEKLTNSCVVEICSYYKDPSSTMIKLKEKNLMKNIPINLDHVRAFRDAFSVKEWEKLESKKGNIDMLDLIYASK